MSAVVRDSGDQSTRPGRINAGENFFHNNSLFTLNKFLPEEQGFTINQKPI